MGAENFVTGLQSAISSYYNAQKAKEDRAAQKQEKELTLRAQGLIPEYDQSGGLISVNEDPAFRERKLQEEISKGAAEGKNLEIGPQGLIFKGYSPEYIKGQQEIYKMKSDANPLSNALKEVELKKKVREVKDPYFNLTDAEKAVAEDSSKKFSGLATIKDSLDSSLKTLDDPSIPEDQKTVAAKNALKLINSIALSAPDVVGAEEVGRTGAYLNPSVMNLLPGQPGPGPLSKPNLKGFTEQLRIISNNTNDRLGLLRQRSGLPEQSGLLKGMQMNGAQAAPPKGPPPGSIVKVNGKRFRVGQDGDTLEPL